MENQLKLLQFTAKSFAGIDKSSPVIICFPQGYGGYIALQGDQATKKTSTIEAFKSACGLPMPENALNRKDNDKRVVFEFERDEKKYRVTISKSRFEVELLIDPQKLKWATVNSPKEMLKTLLGPIGISPMFLKEYDGKKQIEWLKKFFRLDQDALELGEKIEGELKTTYKSRRDAKRDLKKLEGILSTNDYNVNRQKWEEKLVSDGTDTSAEEQIKDVQRRFNIYTHAAAAVENLKTKKGEVVGKGIALDDEIAELERQLQAKKDAKTAVLKEVDQIDTRITDGERWVEENKAVVQENENIAATIKAQEQLATHKANFSQMAEMKKQSDHLHSEFIRLENRLDALRRQKKELIAAFTPEIEGLEVCLPDSAEVDETETDPDKKPETREGLFYKGCSPLELSESELWGLYSQLLEKLDIRIILIENITSLGSTAIDLFDKFIQAGGYVLASEMKRDEKSLKVVVQNKIVETVEDDE